AIGSDTLAVENHLHRRVLLVYKNGMVRTVVEKYAEALGVEIILVGHLHGKIGAEQARTGGHGQEKTHSDSGEHRWDQTLPLLRERQHNRTDDDWLVPEL